MPETTTNLPWSDPGNGNVVGADGVLITRVPRPKGAGATARRDAAIKLIVRSANLHDKMVDWMNDYAEHPPECERHTGMCSCGLDDLLAEARQ